MTKMTVHTNAAPTSSAYSQVVQADGLCVVAGQDLFDSKMGAIVGATIQEQPAQCLRNDPEVVSDPVQPSPTLEN
jgi:enamine deaminase RidA (YjgF/YER057c/UK114 family)